MSHEVRSDKLPPVSDGYTRIIPISSCKIQLQSPLLIAGFPDAGLIGSVSINHIIEQLDMHQIAYFESNYIMPAAIFIGSRFRHPFRIYVNDQGTVCALICEVPVSASGTVSIANTIVEWSINAGVSEIVLLGGILPTNFSPPYLLERKAMLLRNELPQRPAPIAVENIPGLIIPEDAVIVGLAGSLLSVSATHGLNCEGLLIPTTMDSPDPEGAAIVLEALSKIHSWLKIDTSSIRAKVMMLKKQLEELLKVHNQQMRDYESAADRDARRIYK